MKLRDQFSVLNCLWTGFPCRKQYWRIITQIFKLCCFGLNEIGPEGNSGDLYVVTKCSLAMVIVDFRDHLFFVKRKNIYTMCLRGCADVPF